ncbi:MAG: hypothetical protein V4747_04230 [Pseudomonadota bacterium]
MKHIAITAFIFSQIVVVGQASAQTAAFNSTAVSAACSRSAAGCGPVVAAQINTMKSAGLDAAALNEQLALIAVAVISAIQGASPRVAAAYGEILGAIAGNSTDAIQAAALRAIGLEVAQGRVPAVSAVAQSLGPISDN